MYIGKANQWQSWGWLCPPIVQFIPNKHPLYGDTTTDDMWSQSTSWSQKLPCPKIAALKKKRKKTCSCPIAVWTEVNAASAHYLGASENSHYSCHIGVKKIWKRGRVDFTMITVLKISSGGGDLLIKSWQLSHSHSQWHVYSAHAFSTAAVHTHTPHLTVPLHTSGELITANWTCYIYFNTEMHLNLTVKWRFRFSCAWERSNKNMLLLNLPAKHTHTHSHTHTYNR